MTNRKKRNSRPPLGRKRIIITCVWAVTMIVAIALIVSHAKCGRDVETGAQKPSWMADIEQIDIPVATSDTVVHYSGFTVHFNAKWHVPNCVIYELTAAETQGQVPRAKDFTCDERVPGCPLPDAYKGSGYDRGHMAPAADMKWSAQAMNESFMMTNICPQNHSLNEGGWNRLEEKTREWACRDSAVIVISGPILDANPTTIGEEHVALPKRYFKVILAPYVSPVRAIAFIVPNEPANGELNDYVASVDEVERLTGMDFFSALPDQLEQEVESKKQLLLWLQPK